MIQNKQNGFTLIELLLVVGIVTFLSSVLFYNTSEAKKKAEDSHMESEARQVELGLSMFKNDTGRYPLSVRGPNSGALRDKMYIETENEYALAMQELVDGKYLTEIPTSPGGENYGYAVSDDLDEAVFIVSLNKSKTNSRTGSLLCVSSNGEDSSPLCSNVIDSILNPSDENTQPPPVLPEYQFLNLSGGSEQVSLIPGSTYEISYLHGSVNATYGLEGDTSEDTLWTWFMPDLTFAITEMGDWSCDAQGGLLSEGETATCISSNNESIQITNYDSENRIIRITGSLQ